MEAKAGHLPLRTRSLWRLFEQPDEFHRMRALDVVVAFHDVRGPAARFGALVKRIKIVLLR